jgi:hypothetical protein
MIKKILYWIIVVVIVAGAVYSYNKVGFGRSTAMLFQVVFGDSSSMGGPGGGRPPMGANMQGAQPPGMPPEGGLRQGQSGESGFRGGPPIQGNMEGQRPNFQPGGEGGQRPQGDMRPGGGPGGIISLRNVIPYTFIFAFFVLITGIIDRTIRKISQSRSM